MLMMLAFFFLIPCAWAGDDPEAPENQTQKLDEIVVTATQTEHTVMESPTNISVISREEINATDASNFAELVKKIPGVFYTNASGIEPKLSLRGTHIGMSPGALVLVNGIPMSLGEFGYTDYASIPVETIERIEVVKGPISSLYGDNSARGVINITTKRGQGDFGGAINIAGGSYDDKRASVTLRGGTEKTDYSFNVKKKEADAYRDDTWLDNIYASGEFGYWLSEDTRIGTYVNITDKERALAKKLTLEQREEDPTQATDYSLTDNTDVISGFSLEQKKQDYDLTSHLYYKYRDKSYENYLRATSTPYRKTQEEHVFGTRNIFTLKMPLMNRDNKFSMGFDLDYDDIDLLTMKAAAKDASLPYTEKDDKKSGDFASTKAGVFIQDEFSVLDNLTLTLGARYDYYAFDNDADYDFSEGGTHDYDATPSYDNLSPRIALNYLYSKNLGFYGSFSQSYRAPSIYDYYASGSYSATYAYTLEPETFTQFESGFRYRFARWLNLDATVYHLVIDDMLDSAYDDSGTYMGKQNINQATMEGLEMCLSGRILPRVSYKLGYTYTDAVYSDDFYTKNGENINGRRVTKVPYHRVNADIGIDLLKLDSGDLFWNINFTGQDNYAMNNENAGFYGGYGLVNTLLRWTAERYSIFLNVDNVLDKDYDGYAYASSSGTNYYYPAAGTTFSTGIEFRF